MGIQYNNFRFMHLAKYATFLEESEHKNDDIKGRIEKLITSLHKRLNEKYRILRRYLERCLKRC